MMTIKGVDIVESNTLYLGNQVTNIEINRVKDYLIENGSCEVSFDVTGRTLHRYLSKQLANDLEGYNVVIGDNYECKISS